MSNQPQNPPVTKEQLYQDDEKRESFNEENMEATSQGSTSKPQEERTQVGRLVGGVAKPQASKCFLHALQISFLFMGAGAILSSKWQSMYPVDYKYQGTSTTEKTCPPCTGFDQPIPVVCKQPYFVHPFMQTAMAFLGEMLIFPIFFYQRYEKKAQIKYFAEQKEAIAQGRRLANLKIIGWAFFPAFLFLMVGILNFMALSVVPASILAMIQGLSPFLIAIFSICMLNMDLYVNNYLAFLFVIVGMVLVALAGLLNFSDESSTSLPANTKDYIISIILIVASTTFAALYMVVDEIIYQTWFVLPSQLISIEGAWGLILSIILLSIICTVPCNGYGFGCVYNPNKQMFYLESIDTWVSQMQENPALIAAVILHGACLGLNSFLGQNITKYLNSVTRRLIASARTGIIWIGGIIVTVCLPDDPAWKPWESLQWQNILLQLAGFGCLSIALMIHRVIIKLPYKDTWFHKILVPCECCKCNKKLKQLEREQKPIAPEDPDHDENNHLPQQESVKNDEIVDTQEAAFQSHDRTIHENEPIDESIELKSKHSKADDNR